MPDASMADATDSGGMCVNCLSTVDAALWASGGMAVTATSAWGRVRDRVRSSPATDQDQGGANDLAALISELDSAAESDTRGPGVLGYVVALVVFVALGLMLKTVVVNWVVGPLFPLLVLGVVPASVARCRVALSRAARR
jgi:hypothetical protein